MSYRRAILARWSRRDRLAVVIVAVTVAFLVGSALLVLGAGAQTSSIAADYDATGVATTHGSLEAAAAAAPADAIVVQYARATAGDGSARFVVARPDAASDARDLGLAGRDATLGTIDESVRLELSGRAGSVTVEATPRGDSLFSSSWIAADSRTVERLGPTGALAIRPPGPTPERGVPLRSALAFFVLGTQQALAALSVAILGAGLLVGVTVYSISSMTVRDRTTAIRVIRSTGGSPRLVLSLFGLRAGLLTAAGVALGYAVGVILPNAAVSVAVTAGLPVSLDLSFTERAARLLVPLMGAVLLVGTIAGTAAAWSAASRPPGTLRGPLAGGPGTVSGASGLRAWIRPNLLRWRAVVPTTATLTAFVLFAVLVTATGGVIAPMASGDATTITQPGAAHPFASSVPAAYADAVETDGGAASPEILALSVVDGQPFLTRGARFDAFAAVTPARLASGRVPDGPAEAVIGDDLARTLDVDVGDELLLGGSTESRLARVVVVGAYDAPGPFDDQLVVPLATARDLAGRPAEHVHLVRATGVPGTGAILDPETETTYEVSVPDRVIANRSLEVRLTLTNPGSDRREVDVPVRLGEDERRVAVVLAPGETREERITFPVGSPGELTLRVGERTRTVRVIPPTAIDLRVPDRVPPGSEPRVTVTDASGGPVNATVSVGNRTIHTGPDGRARIEFDAAGEYTVVARHAGSRATATVEARPGTVRALDATLAVRPAKPSLVVRPEARLTVTNPWNATWTGAIAIDGVDRRRNDSVSIEPDGNRTLTLELNRHPPGTYAVSASAGGRRIASTEYVVTGDERLASAIGSAGRSGSTGIERAIEAAFGNLRLVLGVILALACLMTVGGTTATFASAVHERRATIGVFRAIGADPVLVVRVVLVDALRLGVVSTGLGLLVGLGLLRVLEHAGYLVVFGVSLSAIPSGRVLLAIAFGGIALTVTGAVLALRGMIGAPPGRLLADGSPPSESSER